MSRKYRQRGYQEEESRSSDSRPRPAAGRHDGPRGRGLGAPTESSFKCARCGACVVVAVVTESTCSKCQADLHSCVNCRHFDASAVNECREAIPVRIAKKDKRNRCDLFSGRIVKGFASDAGTKADDPKAAFDALFDL